MRFIYRKIPENSLQKNDKKPNYHYKRMAPRGSHRFTRKAVCHLTHSGDQILWISQCDIRSTIEYSGPIQYPSQN